VHGDLEAPGNALPETVRELGEDLIGEKRELRHPSGVIGPYNEVVPTQGTSPPTTSAQQPQTAPSR
jgi:hypothetical protein